MAHPEEREQVVFTEGIERDVFDEHHLIVGDVEEGVVDQFVDIDGIAAGQFPIGPGDAGWGVAEPLSLGVFSDERQ